MDYIEKKEWLKTLKVGDEVFVNTTRYSTLSGFLAKLKRETKLYFFVDSENGRFEYKFRKDDGREPGSGYHHARIEPFTKYLKNRIIVLNLQKKVKDLRDKIIIPYTIPELETLIDSLSPFVKD